MRTLTDQEFHLLSGADWNRIHRSLRKRFGNFDDGNVANIAFGAKRRKGRIGSVPIKSVRFLVRHKRTPRAKIDRIDPAVSVPFRHGKSGKWVNVLIPTDVEEVRKIIPTGTSIADNDSGELIGTTGLAVDVTHSALGTPFHTFGFITVGHPLENVGVPRQVTGQRRGRKSRNVPGTIRKRTFPRAGSPFDGAFAEARQIDLTHGHYLLGDGSSNATLSERELKEVSDNHETGRILRSSPKGPAHITAIDYIPETLPSFDPQFGVMRGVLRGEAEQKGVLFVGTSGSVWRFRNQIASLQFAAEEGLRIGYSQAAFALLQEWLKPSFAASRIRILNSF